MEYKKPEPQVIPKAQPYTSEDEEKWPTLDTGKLNSSIPKPSQIKPSISSSNKKNSAYQQLSEPKEEETMWPTLSTKPGPVNTGNALPTRNTRPPKQAEPSKLEKEDFPTLGLTVEPAQGPTLFDALGANKKSAPAKPENNKKKEKPKKPHIDQAKSIANYNNKPVATVEADYPSLGNQPLHQIEEKKPVVEKEEKDSKKGKHVILTYDKLQKEDDDEIPIPVQPVVEKKPSGKKAPVKEEDDFPTLPSQIGQPVLPMNNVHLYIKNKQNLLDWKADISEGSDSEDKKGKKGKKGKNGNKNVELNNKPEDFPKMQASSITGKKIETEAYKKPELKKFDDMKVEEEETEKKDKNQKLNEGFEKAMKKLDNMERKEDDFPSLGGFGSIKQPVDFAPKKLMPASSIPIVVKKKKK